jgi:cytochrome P450
MAKVVDPDTGRVNLFSEDFARCPQAGYAELRSRCPVGRMVMTGSPVISRYEDVAWALRHPEIFSSEMEAQLALGTERPMIPQQIDPPAQTRYRKLLDPHFSRRKMEELAPAIARHATELIDAFEKQGRCEFDSAFAIPLPCSAFLHLLGLPLADLDFFLRLKDGIIRPQKNRPGVPLDQLQGVRKESGAGIYEYFERTLDDREARPREDMLTALMRAEIEGERLSRTEILDICFLLLLAGLDTVTATLGCNMAYLAANPEQRRRLVRDPALIPGAVEELLRWETPVVAVPRVVKRNVTIGDVELVEGELATLLLGAANTDDAHFDDAQRVDFERERNIHMAFGAGPHRCLGSHLARMELRVAMEVWHARIPEYRIAPGETVRYSPGIREALYLPLVWEV